MSDAASPPAGWHPDPTGRHGQRWWDGRQWTVHVADGQAVASDPVVEATDRSEEAAQTVDVAGTRSADAAHRADVEGAVRASDDGRLPRGWPERYEQVIAEVLGDLDPAEIVHRAWRIRTTGPRQRISDVGLLVVTDRQVVGADRSARSSGSFRFPRSDVATVALVHRRLGNSDLGYEIRLMGPDDRVLGTEESPAEFQVFDKGRDPSRWDSHPQDEEQLLEVQQALIWRLPGAKAVRSEVELSPTEPQPAPAADHLDHPPPGAAIQQPVQPEGAVGASASTAEAAGSSADETDDAAAQPMTIGSAIGSLVVGILVLAIAGFFITDILSSECEREGIAMTCISSGGSIRVETEYNLLLIGVGSLFGLLSLVRGIVGLVARARSGAGKD